MQYGKPPINPGVEAILRARRGASVRPDEKTMRPTAPPPGNMRPGVPGPARPMPGSPSAGAKPSSHRMTPRARK